MEHPSLSVKTDGGKLSHAVFFVLISQLGLICQSQQCHHFWFGAIMGKISPEEKMHGQDQFCYCSYSSTLTGGVLGIHLLVYIGF